MNIDGLILAHAPRQEMARRIASLCVRPDIEVFYFGCIGGPGHFFNAPKRRRADAYELEREVSAALGRGGLDGQLCWNSPRSDRDRYNRRDETEGRAFRTCHGGYTAVAFWDRSVDRRGACNSAFIVRGELTFEQVIRAARQAWPKIWARFTFPIVEVDERGRAECAAGRLAW